MYKEFLNWEDDYPLHHVDNSIFRYLSEFLLPFGQQITAKVNFGYTGKSIEDDKFYIKADTIISGTNLFSFYKKKGTGEFILNNEGLFCEFSYNNKHINFEGKFIYKEEVQQ